MPRCFGGIDLPTSGWSVQKIVNQVNGRSENRATNKPNFDILMEFFLALDEFCGEKHYWWRRKAASFQAQVGVQSYDLSTNSTGSANARDAVEIEEAYIVNASPFLYPKMVHPAFTARQQIAAMFSSQVVSENPIPRGGYFLTPGQFQSFELTYPPQQPYTIAFTYYATPMITDTADAANNPIPLVPPNLHWGMLYALERRVYEYLYGQNDPRWVTSNARYKDFVAAAARYKQFSVQEAIESRMQGPSVVSSGGRARPTGFVSG